MMTRARLYAILEKSPGQDRIGRQVDMALITLIVINIVAVILETVDSLDEAHGFWFALIELVSIFVFTLEYGLRVWVAAEAEAEGGDWEKRFAYMRSPSAIIDLLAVAPFYLQFVVTLDLRFLRVLRLLRIFKLTRYSSALTMLLDAIHEEAGSFYAAFFILIVLLVIASSGAYLFEGEAQPEAFGSIPAAMWWAIVTLTTVGYGDVYPITPMGRLFGALVTVTGVGMAALPAGILASGITTQIARKRDKLKHELHAALADGVIDLDEERELEEFRRELGLNRLLADEVRAEVLRARRRNLRQCPHCGEPLEH